ncbi:uncharacterized protein LOC130647904 [Hydractinia symbiolongicarpus]|uniref:uncharacterized protein LOC130647904 n=1 Tax=Hydractinia symbiolongicarpus TaxID=13093 RepID=UPI00254FFA91|nr:uncharacterized protein LOC130647904 [Hydractinia symbiolongicarpus]
MSQQRKKSAKNPDTSKSIQPVTTPPTSSQQPGTPPYVSGASRVQLKRQNNDCMVAYVQNLSPEKRSKRNPNCRYYNMQLQTNDGSFEAVCYKPGAKRLFEEACTQKSAIKLTRFKRKANYKNNLIQDIEIGKFTTVSGDTANFPYVGLKKDVAQLTTVVDIKYHGYDKQMVSVEGYINVNECYQSAYSQFSSKKEVYFNDDTNAIVLTLWDDCINLVPRSGTYKLSNVIVRCLESYKDEPVIISTVSSTVIEISVVNIKQMMPAFTINRIKKFPILDFNISARNKKCPKCKTNAAADSLTDFFKCISCSSFSRYSKLETMRTVKVTFEEDKEKEVTIFGMQLQDYCAHFGISVNDEDAITESFLKNEKSSAVVNRQDVCVAFKH